MSWKRRVTARLTVPLLLTHSVIGLGQSRSTTVRDRPFYASEWVTKTSTAPNGTVNVTTQQIAIARASDGTVRRELHEPAPGSERITGKPVVLVSILNPDKNISSAVYQGKAAATAMDISTRKTVPVATRPTSDGNKTPSPSEPGELTKVSGLSAEVHQSQYSVPAKGPKDKANTVSTELWFSPDLLISLKSSVSDSNGVTVVTVLDDIHQQEPDPSLFHVSTDAKTIQK